MREELQRKILVILQHFGLGLATYVALMFATGIWNYTKLESGLYLVVAFYVAYGLIFWGVVASDVLLLARFMKKKELKI